MNEKCWNCANEFEPHIIKKPDNRVAFCPKCSTRHIYIENDPGKLIISSAITNEDKVLHHPPVEVEKPEEAKVTEEAEE